MLPIWMIFQASISTSKNNDELLFQNTIGIASQRNVISSPVQHNWFNHILWETFVVCYITKHATFYKKYSYLYKKLFYLNCNVSLCLCFFSKRKNCKIDFVTNQPERLCILRNIGNDFECISDQLKMYIRIISLLPCGI